MPAESMEKERYEYQKKLYDDDMRLWESFNQTSVRMDERFDKTLFAIAAGSFGISFAFIDKIVPLATAVFAPLLFAAWSCFAVCLAASVIGNLISAETYRKQRDEIAKNLILKYEGKLPEEAITVDFVSPCNYIALISYLGGIVCLLLFVLLNLL